MVSVQLSYGLGYVKLEIPERNLAQIIQPRKQEASEDIAGSIRLALENPQGITLEETVTNRRVGVLIEDGTRAEPHETIIDELARKLGSAKELIFFITSGSHESDSPRNREIIQAIHSSAKQHNLHPYHVVSHDALESPCQEVGITSRGTVVKVNEIAVGVEAFVVAADMKNHYFAGYSNAIKNFLPGLCNFTAIETNHSLALEPDSTFGRHPFHSIPARRSNPVAEDMVEAMNLIVGKRPVFLLATITSGSYILWTGCGDVTTVSREGFDRIDEVASFDVTPTDHIIVSPGGSPQDESLYNAQRGLELTKNAVRDHGEVLLLAECPKGIAPTPKSREFFYDYLVKPLPEVIAGIKGQYRLYSHKAFKFAELLTRLDRIWIHTTLDPSIVASAHLDFASNPQDIVKGWIKNNSDAQILAFHDANKIAVYARS